MYEKKPWLKFYEDVPATRSRQVMFAISINETIDISGLCCLL